ncbi:MAG: hypothetical protein J1E16_09430 [Muribaculaceae bacterium]|nr:hypothetical protein [Muribaculaceae bacterium]
MSAKATKTKKENKEEKIKKSKKGLKGVPRDLVNDMRYGRSLSLEFFRQNAWLLMLFVVAVIALMGLRYKTKTKMEEIKQLTVELQRAQSSKLQEKAAYMSLIREAEMKKLVDEKGLGLQFQEYPPYELTLDE